MTTPPCSEGVTWIVFTNPVKVMSSSVSTSDKTSMRHTALQCTSSAMHNAALQRCETLGSELLGMQGQLHMLSMTDKICSSAYRLAFMSGADKITPNAVLRGGCMPHKQLLRADLNCAGQVAVPIKCAYQPTVRERLCKC